MFEEIITSAVLSLALITTPIPVYTSAPQEIIEMAHEPQIKTWEVKSGDSLAAIAESVYGNSLFWTIVWNDNSFIENPDVVHSGLHLKLRSQKPVDNEELKPELLTKMKELQKKPLPQPTREPVSPTSSPTTIISDTQSVSFEDVYKEAGEKYGVSWQVLYGLHMTETGGRDGYIVSGYGTGARGPMQFMPGTFNAYAVDGDGDGIPNIDNAKDAIHTAAHYLAQHGSLENGLKSYGGNTSTTLELARSKGFSE